MVPFKIIFGHQADPLGPFRAYMHDELIKDVRYLSDEFRLMDRLDGIADDDGMRQSSAEPKP